MPRKTSAVPGTRPETDPYRMIAPVALGIILLAAVVFALIKELDGEPVSTPGTEQQQFALAGDAALNEWFERYRQQEPFTGLDEFRQVRTASLNPINVFPSREDVAYRAVVSPDGLRSVDYLASHGEPDSRIDLHGNRPDGDVETLAFCGTPCIYDTVYWRNNGEFVVLGTEEAPNDDGTTPCVEDRCRRRLVATVYDLIAREIRTYASEPHLLPADLYAAEKDQRYGQRTAPAVDNSVGTELQESIELR